MKTRKTTTDKKKERTQRNIRLGLIFLLILAIVLVILRQAVPQLFTQAYEERPDEEIDATKPEIDVQLLSVNPYSRPGMETNKITGIVIHYTANPGSSAKDNRDYFEGLKRTHATKTSSNFIVGLEGEIIQCVPTWEVAYASNNRNQDTVSIECCHPDETGQFNEATYRSMVQLTGWLCLKFDLTETDVIRHYDITGKNCPKYFVEHEEAWEKFRSDVGQAIRNTDPADE